MLPKARKKDLIIQNLDDETLVYDLRTNKAHCLNASASLVWKCADGKTTIADMTKRLSGDLDVGAKTDIVRLAMTQLVKAGLLQEETIDKAELGTRSRREILKAGGKAIAVALPLITSLIAPEAAQAASCVAVSACQTVAGRKYKGRCCCGSQTTHKICATPPSPSQSGVCQNSPLC